MVAAEDNNIDVLQKLCQLGANINAEDMWSNTALHKAVQKQHLKPVKILIRNGGKLEENDESKTPLDIARSHKNKKIIKVLEEAFAPELPQTNAGSLPMRGMS